MHLDHVYLVDNVSNIWEGGDFSFNIFLCLAIIDKINCVKEGL